MYVFQTKNGPKVAIIIPQYPHRYSNFDLVYIHFGILLQEVHLVFSSFVWSV